MLAGKKLGDRVALGSRVGPDENRTRAAAAKEVARIMRCDDLSGEIDVGEVAAISVDSWVERKRRPSQSEMLTRAGEGFPARG